MLLAPPAATAPRPAATTPAAVASPEAPSDVVATATPGAVDLAWHAPLVTQATVLTYLITETDTTTAATSAPIASPGGASTSTQIGGLTAGDAYTFTVQARTTDGETPASAPSNPVTAEAAPATTTTTPTKPTPKPKPTPRKKKPKKKTTAKKKKKKKKKKKAR